MDSILTWGMSQYDIYDLKWKISQRFDIRDIKGEKHFLDTGITPNRKKLEG